MHHFKQQKPLVSPMSLMHDEVKDFCQHSNRRPSNENNSAEEPSSTEARNARAAPCRKVSFSTMQTVKYAILPTAETGPRPPVFHPTSPLIQELHQAHVAPDRTSGSSLTKRIGRAPNLIGDELDVVIRVHIVPLVAKWLQVESKARSRHPPNPILEPPVKIGSGGCLSLGWSY